LQHEVCNAACSIRDRSIVCERPLAPQPIKSVDGILELEEGGPRAKELAAG
jgi:hypothetical protein